MTFNPRYLNEQTNMNTMNVSARDAMNLMPARLSRSFPQDIQTELANVEMEMMQSVVKARLRAVQQMSDLRLYQQVTNTSINNAKSIRGPSPAKGLDLLGSASSSTIRLPTSQRQTPLSMAPSPHCLRASPTNSFNINTNFVNPTVTINDNASTKTKESSASTPKQPATLNEDGSRLYINVIQDWDVMCGRGGRSNHHSGNKRYRHVVSDIKLMYRRTEAKAVKTDLSRAIVEHVCDYGGRFIKQEGGANGRYYVLTKAEARKKTSQALRETKALKWTL